MSKNAHHSEAVVTRCEAVIEHLQNFPGTFDMRRFMYGTNIDTEHPCGTVGCLAGTLVFLEDGPLSGKVTHAEWKPNFGERLSALPISDRAEELLEIQHSVGYTLWYPHYWPEHLRAQHLNKDGVVDCGAFTAQDGIDRIQHFLTTGT